MEDKQSKSDFYLYLNIQNTSLFSKIELKIVFPTETSSS